MMYELECEVKNIKRLERERDKVLIRLKQRQDGK